MAEAGAADSKVCVYVGEALGRYGFPSGHPFGPDRLEAFWRYATEAGVDRQVHVCDPVKATRGILERFHTPEYVARVIEQSASGAGYLDYGDTPAFPGVYEAAAYVVGSTVDAVARIMAGECRRAFVPIAGLHHARRDGAAGFCVFNDCGVALEMLRHEYALDRVAYVDIDAHHGDGVYYAFEEDAGVFIADLHEDGQYLYPGTGTASEMGRGAAAGSKLNVPMAPGAGSRHFMEAWDHVESFLARAQPQFILLQCGADSLAGDPLTHLQYTPDTHHYAAARLAQLADEFCDGRLLALGGGGYNRDNLARAWTAVVQALLGGSAAD